MAALDTNTLLGEAKCYECYGPLTQAQLLTLALERRQLLAANPAADTTPQALISYAECYACYGLSMFEMMDLALLDQIAQA